MRKNFDRPRSFEEEQLRNQFIDRLDILWRDYRAADQDVEKKAEKSAEIRALLTEVSNELLLRTPEEYTLHIEEDFPVFDEMDSYGEFTRSFEGAQLKLRDGVLSVSARNELGNMVVKAFEELFGDSVRDSFTPHNRRVGVILEKHDPKRGKELLVELKSAYESHDDETVVRVMSQIRDLVASRTITYQDTRHLGLAYKPGSQIEFIANLGSGTGGQRILLKGGHLLFPSQGEGLSRELQEGFVEVFGDLVEGTDRDPKRWYLSFPFSEQSLNS